MRGDNTRTVTIKLSGSMYGNEGREIAAEYKGREITRKIRYNARDGLYIVIDNRRFYEYEERIQDNGDVVIIYQELTEV